MCYNNNLDGTKIYKEENEHFEEEGSKLNLSKENMLKKTLMIKMKTKFSEHAQQQICNVKTGGWNVFTIFHFSRLKVKGPSPSLAMIKCHPYGGLL